MFVRFPFPSAELEALVFPPQHYGSSRPLEMALHQWSSALQKVKNFLGIFFTK